MILPNVISKNPKESYESFQIINKENLSKPDLNIKEKINNQDQNIKANGFKMYGESISSSGGGIQKGGRIKIGGIPDVDIYNNLHFIAGDGLIEAMRGSYNCETVLSFVWAYLLSQICKSDNNIFNWEIKLKKQD